MRNQEERAGNLLPKVFTFNPSNAPIRVQVINQNPYFVAKDICKALSLTDTGKTVERLDEDEKLMRTLFVSGQNRPIWLVNESGLYALIFQSRKQEAKAFRKWVTGEVLPSLRRTGTYAVHDNDCCSATLWRHRKYGPPQLTAPRMGEWLDLRDIPYSTIPLNDYRVRIIRHNDVDWYSVNDILKATNNSTSSCDVVRRLNANRTIAIRIFIYGNTHPAWFCTLTGMQLIVCGKKTEGGSHGN